MGFDVIFIFKFLCLLVMKKPHIANSNSMWHDGNETSHLASSHDISNFFLQPNFFWAIFSSQSWFFETVNGLGVFGSLETRDEQELQVPELITGTATELAIPELELPQASPVPIPNIRELPQAIPVPILINYGTATCRNKAVRVKFDLANTFLPQYAHSLLQNPNRHPIILNRHPFLLNRLPAFHILQSSSQIQPPPSQLAVDTVSTRRFSPHRLARRLAVETLSQGYELLVTSGSSSSEQFRAVPVPVPKIRELLYAVPVPVPKTREPAVPVPVPVPEKRGNNNNIFLEIKQNSVGPQKSRGIQASKPINPDNTRSGGTTVKLRSAAEIDWTTGYRSPGGAFPPPPPPPPPPYGGGGQFRPGDGDGFFGGGGEDGGGGDGDGGGGLA
ncbi:hypothetical protein LXL04_025055 [Taraxacum kok-saghyz]